MMNNRQGNRPGNRMGNRPGNRPGTRPGNKPGTENAVGRMTGRGGPGIAPDMATIQNQNNAPGMGQPVRMRKGGSVKGNGAAIRGVKKCKMY